MSELPEVRASDEERERAVVRLRDAAAEGRLTLEEFTERVHTAYDARTRVELEQLVRDLPVQTAATTAPVPARRSRGWIVSVMGNAARRGRWRVAEHTNAIALMGNATIDLRDAVLSAPEVEITVFCCMGNAHILVPDGVDVDLSAVAIMGNKFDVRRVGPPEPGAPVVRVGGLVLMGNLTLRSSSRGRSGPELPGVPPLS